MNKELQRQILNWLIDNENKWQRVNSCTKEFKEYIYNSNGEYLIGGEDVSDFITSANKLIYPS